ncbi:MAG: formyltransferase family protein [Patescibacteria group bacterium]
MKPRIAVLASGSGTTVEAFVRAGQAGDITTTVELVICNRHDAGVFQRIKDLNAEFGLNIQTLLINNKNHPAVDGEPTLRGRQTVAEESAILETLRAGNFDLIALMGYMKHVGPNLVQAFGWLPEYKSIFQAKMVNTHPGLLPDTKAFYGQSIQEYVLQHHLPYAGQTLHVVAEEYDEGPIVAEHKVPVQPGDTPETLFARVQDIEKQYLPRDIEDFVKARLAYNMENKEA